MKTLLLSLATLFITNGTIKSQSCEELLLAVQCSNYDQVESLLKIINPNCHHDGIIQPRSPLGMAASTGDLKTVKLLFKQGAKANYRFKRDASALMIASQKGHYKIAKYLTENGAKINLKLMVMECH
jgi:ankyrin repeat protein